MKTNIKPIAALAMVVIASVSGAGCGAPSSSGGSRGSAGDGATGDAAAGREGAAARDKAVKFSECVRAHGVRDFPDPNADGDFDYGVSVSPAVWQRAIEACKALQPPGSLSSDRTAKEQLGSIRFAGCIREHGVHDFPDPVNGEPPIDTTKIPSTDTEQGMAVLNAAIAACRGVASLEAGGQR